MAKQVWTSDELIGAVRDALASGNTGATGGDDARILKHLNLAMLNKVVPEVLKVREEYFVTTTESVMVAGVSRYRIPERAFLGKLRNIFLVSGDDLKNLREITPEDRWRYDTDSAGADPAGYYIEGLDVVLLPPVPTSSVSGSIEFSFYFRPNDLVLAAEARQVISVNLAAKQVVIATDPASWTTELTYDIHGQTSGGQMKAFDLTVTSIQVGVPMAGQDTYTFTQAIDGTVKGRRPVEVGDWLCLAGEAVVPMLPKEMHGILIDAAALRILKALGDQPNIQSQAGLLASDMDGLTTVTERRNEGKPLRIRGRGGLLWGGRR